MKGNNPNISEDTATETVTTESQVPNPVQDIPQTENIQQSAEIQKPAVIEVPDKTKYKMKKSRHSNFNRGFGKITVGLLIVLVVMCSFFGGYTTASFLQSEDAAVAEWLVEVLNDQAYYANYDGLDAAFLMENGLSFCLREDPYCDLMTPEETTEYYTTASGSSTSFGVSIGTYSGLDGVYVVSVVMGSSAQIEGLSEGMRIVAIDGEDFYDKEMDDVSVVLLGKDENESVTIECLMPIINDYGYISYDVDSERFVATITKQEYTPIVVEYYDNQTAGLEGLADETAYIKITSFVGKTGEQFIEAMEWYEETGKTKLILDLRDNTGGSEENMKVVGSYLLKAEEEGKNPLIITIEDKYGNSTEIRADGSYYEEMSFDDVIVLVDGNTASASEAILTAMIDYGTVDIIIGETTYGKGTGLTTVFMPIYGYSVTFTSSYFFSPYGNSHDQTGLSPTNGYSVLDSVSFPYSYEEDDILQRGINAMK
ncbi:MAG: S41 family peptidase [Bacillota bacterium]